MLSENVVNITLCASLAVRHFMSQPEASEHRPIKGNNAWFSNNFGLRAAPGQHSVYEMTFSHMISHHQSLVFHRYF